MDSLCWTLVLRSSIFIGLTSVVVLILSFTPLPDQFPKSCTRPCYELDWPMICRFKLTLEHYQTLSRRCNNCPTNQTDCFHKECITANGEFRQVTTVNRQLPGPSLQVCQNDIVVVDIVNRIPGQSFGVHWRGQHQSDTPYMDGVPMITQCPIPCFTTFQYKFRAKEAGTHVWQINTGEDLSETLFGPLIVKKPDSEEVHKNLYETDDPSNVVVVHSWSDQNYVFGDSVPRKLLINGKAQENGFPPSVFNISSNKSHRFRVIYQGGVLSCQVRLTITNHKFLVIALDGQPIQPRSVTSVKIFPGERLDFVLKADRDVGSYLIRVEGVECPNLSPVFALIQYDGRRKPLFGNGKDKDEINDFQVNEMSTIFEKEIKTKRSTVSLDKIRSFFAMPEELSKSQPDLKFFFFYNSFISLANHKTESPSIGIVNRNNFSIIPAVNKFKMMLPSSPLISQFLQIPADSFCSSDSTRKRCESQEGSVCECVHVVKVPLNTIVELVLINQDADHHVFHLHGYNFYVVGVSDIPSNHSTPEDIKSLYLNNSLVEKNFDYPIIKDTVALKRNSIVSLRLKADNPGFWLLSKEQSNYWRKGMSLVLHVGDPSDVPPVPENFPECGNWIGPQFFLM